MKEDDEYELTPHRELVKLKEELERLKKSNDIESHSSDDLLGHVKELNHSIKSLTNIFKEAAQDITHSDDKIHEVKENFNPMMLHLETLVEQNKKIAAGIVSVAELIKEKLNEPTKPKDDPVPGLMGQPQGAPMMAPPSDPLPPLGGLQDAGTLMPPPMSFSDPASPGPPIPDPFQKPEEKKKGLFTKFK